MVLEESLKFLCGGISVDLSCFSMAFDRFGSAGMLLSKGMLHLRPVTLALTLFFFVELNDIESHGDSSSWESANKCDEVPSGDVEETCSTPIGELSGDDIGEKLISLRASSADGKSADP